MTCACKAELAEILYKVLEAGRASAYGNNGPNPDHAQPYRDMKKELNRLCFSPALAEPQEPLTGWRAKCDVRRCAAGWFIATVIDGHCWMLCEDDKWRYAPAEGEGEKTAMFDTESAARAALLAASEPGKPASLSECRTLTEATRYCMEHPEPTKPAPAPFDAAKLVLEKITRVNDRDCICYGNFIPGVPASTLGNTQMAVKAIVELITAAHEAGKAEAGQPRLRYEVLNAKKEVIAAFRDHYSATVFCNGLDGRSVVDTQPAAPAEKEPPHAN